jgi:hypothetical protein
MDVWGNSFGSSFGSSFGYEVTVITPTEKPYPGGVRTEVSGDGRPNIQKLYADKYRVESLKEAQALREKILKEDNEVVEIIISMLQSGVIK